MYPKEIAESFFNLVQISIDKNHKELYTKYLKELEAVVRKHPKNFFENLFQTAHAIVLKVSSPAKRLDESCRHFS